MQSGQPVIVLKEGSTETKGREALRNNLQAAKLIAELVKTSLGPRGMDKMLVDSLGDVTITNDGATMLKQLDIQHPAAKMMVEISKATDSEVGDGTTSAVILAGSLLEKAEELLDKNVHPTLIVDGYMSASEKALEILNQISTKVDATDRVWLSKVASTSLLSKIVSQEAKQLADIVVSAVLQVADRVGDGYRVDVDNVKVEKKPGRSLSETDLIKGIVVDKEVVHAGMPKKVQNAKIALLNAPLEIEKTEISAEIRINDPTQMKAFLDEESRMLKSMVEKIQNAGANVVFCQKGIDDIAQHYLAKAGILAVRRVKESDMSRLARSTGGRVVTNLDDLTSSDLGQAELVEERKIEEDKWVYVEGCKNPKAVTILIRGGSQRIVDEAERAVHDAIMVVKDVMEKPSIVPGGGAAESEIAQRIRDWAKTLSGREQLAALAFADAVESIPLTLAVNAGMDPIDTQVELKAEHAKGRTSYGVNVAVGKVGDMAQVEVFEPTSVKSQIIKSATEAAVMILRIDDVIAAKGTGKEEGKGPKGGEGEGEEGAGTPGGMGGEY
ncbi:MAG: thermosome subunit beta [Conexivisphaerales archaeon]